MAYRSIRRLKIKAPAVCWGFNIEKIIIVRISDEKINIIIFSF